MSNIQLKAWSNLEYKRPREWLVALAKVEQEVVPFVAEPKVAALRTNRLKWVREARQAGLLSYGMEQLTHKTINFALYEDGDVDFIACYIEDDIINYVPVQLKELVPDMLNPALTLEIIFDGLKKYSDQSNLVVGIYVSRKVILAPKEILLTGTNFKEVWLFGSCSPDNNRWFVCGDIQSHPEYLEYDYPE